MWKNTYKDYKPDSYWVKESVEPGCGIIGCEMNELNGWGEKQHFPIPRKKGAFRKLLHFLLKKG
jgi:hypothetical protein